MDYWGASNPGHEPWVLDRSLRSAEFAAKIGRDGDGARRRGGARPANGRIPVSSFIDTSTGEPMDDQSEAVSGRVRRTAAIEAMGSPTEEFRPSTANLVAGLIIAILLIEHRCRG